MPSPTARVANNFKTKATMASASSSSPHSSATDRSSDLLSQSPDVRSGSSRVAATAAGAETTDYGRAARNTRTTHICRKSYAATLSRPSGASDFDLVERGDEDAAAGDDAAPGKGREGSDEDDKRVAISAPSPGRGGRRGGMFRTYNRTYSKPEPRKKKSRLARKLERGWSKPAALPSFKSPTRDADGGSNITSRFSVSPAEGRGARGKGDNSNVTSRFSISPPKGGNAEGGKGSPIDASSRFSSSPTVDQDAPERFRDSYESKNAHSEKNLENIKAIAQMQEEALRLSTSIDVPLLQVRVDGDGEDDDEGGGGFSPLTMPSQGWGRYAGDSEEEDEEEERVTVEDGQRQKNNYVAAADVQGKDSEDDVDFNAGGGDFGDDDEEEDAAEEERVAVDEEQQKIHYAAAVEDTQRRDSKSADAAHGDDGKNDDGRLEIDNPADDIAVQHEQGGELKGDARTSAEAERDDESRFSRAESEGAAGGEDEERPADRRGSAEGGSESVVDYQHDADDRQSFEGEEEEVLPSTFGGKKPPAEPFACGESGIAFEHDAACHDSDEEDEDGDEEGDEVRDEQGGKSEAEEGGNAGKRPKDKAAGTTECETAATKGGEDVTRLADHGESNEDGDEPDVDWQHHAENHYSDDEGEREEVVPSALERGDPPAEPSVSNEPSSTKVDGEEDRATERPEASTKMADSIVDDGKSKGEHDEADDCHPDEEEDEEANPFAFEAKERPAEPSASNKTSTKAGKGGAKEPMKRPKAAKDSKTTRKRRGVTALALAAEQDVHGNSGDAAKKSRATRKRRGATADEAQHREEEEEEEEEDEAKPPAKSPAKSPAEPPAEPSASNDAASEPNAASKRNANEGGAQKLTTQPTTAKRSKATRKPRGATALALAAEQDGHGDSSDDDASENDWQHHAEDRQSEEEEDEGKPRAEPSAPYKPMSREARKRWDRAMKRSAAANDATRGGRGATALALANWNDGEIDEQWQHGADDGHLGEEGEGRKPLSKPPSSNKAKLRKAGKQGRRLAKQPKAAKKKLRGRRGATALALAAEHEETGMTDGGKPNGGARRNGRRRKKATAPASAAEHDQAEKTDAPGEKERAERPVPARSAPAKKKGRMRKRGAMALALAEYDETGTVDSYMNKKAAERMAMKASEKQPLEEAVQAEASNEIEDEDRRHASFHCEDEDHGRTSFNCDDEELIGTEKQSESMIGMEKQSEPLLSSSATEPVTAAAQSSSNSTSGKLKQSEPLLSSVSEPLEKAAAALSEPSKAAAATDPAAAAGPATDSAKNDASVEDNARAAGEMIIELRSEIDEMGRALLCPICRSTLKDAKILPCVHAFCGGCLRDYFHPKPMRDPKNKRKKLSPVKVKNECPVCKASNRGNRSGVAAPHLDELVRAYKGVGRAFGFAPVVYGADIVMTQMDPLSHEMEESQEEGEDGKMPAVEESDDARQKRESNLKEYGQHLQVCRTVHGAFLERTEQLQRRPATRREQTENQNQVRRLQLLAKEQEAVVAVDERAFDKVTRARRAKEMLAAKTAKFIAEAESEAAHVGSVGNSKRPSGKADESHAMEKRGEANEPQKANVPSNGSINIEKIPGEAKAGVVESVEVQILDTVSKSSSAATESERDKANDNDVGSGKTEVEEKMRAPNKDKDHCPTLFHCDDEELSVTERRMETLIETEKPSSEPLFGIENPASNVPPSSTKADEEEDGTTEGVEASRKRANSSKDDGPPEGQRKADEQRSGDEEDDEVDPFGFEEKKHLTEPPASNEPSSRKAGRGRAKESTKQHKTAGESRATRKRRGATALALALATATEQNDRGDSSDAAKKSRATRKRRGATALTLATERNDRGDSRDAAKKSRATRKRRGATALAPNAEQDGHGDFSDAGKKTRAARKRKGATVQARAAERDNHGDSIENDGASEDELQHQADGQHSVEEKDEGKRGKAEDNETDTGENEAREMLDAPYEDEDGGYASFHCDDIELVGMERRTESESLIVTKMQSSEPVLGIESQLSDIEKDASSATDISDYVKAFNETHSNKTDADEGINSEKEELHTAANSDIVSGKKAELSIEAEREEATENLQQTHGAKQDDLGEETSEQAKRSKQDDEQGINRERNEELDASASRDIVSGKRLEPSIAAESEVLAENLERIYDAERDELGDDNEEEQFCTAPDESQSVAYSTAREQSQGTASPNAAAPPSPTVIHDGNTVRKAPRPPESPGASSNCSTGIRGTRVFDVEKSQESLRKASASMRGSLRAAASSGTSSIQAPERESTATVATAATARSRGSPIVVHDGNTVRKTRHDAGPKKSTPDVRSLLDEQPMFDDLNNVITARTSRRKGRKKPSPKVSLDNDPTPRRSGKMSPIPAAAVAVTAAAAKEDGTVVGIDDGGVRDNLPLPKLGEAAAAVASAPTPVEHHAEQENEQVIAKGTIVSVQARTWPGINKPGGVARVTKVHAAADSCNNSTKYDVAYILGGKEKQVDESFVRLQEVDALETIDEESPNDSRRMARVSISPEKRSRPVRQRKVAAAAAKTEQPKASPGRSAASGMPGYSDEELKHIPADVLKWAGIVPKAKKGRSKAKVGAEGGKKGVRAARGKKRVLTESDTNVKPKPARKKRKAGAATPAKKAGGDTSLKQDHESKSAERKENASAGATPAEEDGGGESPEQDSTAKLVQEKGKAAAAAMPAEKDGDDVSPPEPESTSKIVKKNRRAAGTKPAKKDGYGESLDSNPTSIVTKKRKAAPTTPADKDEGNEPQEELHEQSPFIATSKLVRKERKAAATKPAKKVEESESPPESASTSKIVRKKRKAAATKPAKKDQVNESRPEPDSTSKLVKKKGKAATTMPAEKDEGKKSPDQDHEQSHVAATSKLVKEKQKVAATKSAKSNGDSETPELDSTPKLVKKKGKVAATKPAKKDEESESTPKSDSTSKLVKKKRKAAATTPAKKDGDNMPPEHDHDQSPAVVEGLRGVISSLSNEEIVGLADARYYSLLSLDKKPSKSDTLTLHAVTSSLTDKDSKFLDSLCKMLKEKHVVLKITKDFNPKKTQLCITAASLTSKAPAKRSKNEPIADVVSKSRTLKVMRSALAGIPILTPQWMESCLKGGHLVAPSGAMCVRTLPRKHAAGAHSTEDGKDVPAEHFGVAKYAAAFERISLLSSGHLLSGFSVLLCGKSAGAGMTKDLKVLLQQAGASVINSASAASRLLTDMSGGGIGSSSGPLVFLCDDSSTNKGCGVSDALFRQAKKLTENSPASEEAEDARVLCLHFGWLFDSISCAAPMRAAAYEPSAPRSRALWALTARNGAAATGDESQVY